MSLSATLSSAISGLTVASRQAEVASSNIANAMTEGYGRRELQISARQVGDRGQGVQIDGTTRRVNQALLSDRRVAIASRDQAATTQAFLKSIETAIGTSDDPDSLISQVSALDTALLAATSRPDSQGNLANIASAARALAAGLHSASDTVQSARMRADQQIAKEVNRVNEALDKVRQMNLQIQAMRGANQDPSALMDQRQKLVDEISTIIPVKEAARENGQIALYTTSGAVLLDGVAAKIGFSGVGVITPDMTFASGALSGLTLNGRDIAAFGEGALLQGGSLSAQFVIRDELAVNVQTDLDALARDLVERFQDPALDPTLLPGDPGLFTDLGLAFDPLNEIGLSQRLTLNAAVDPAQGGELWRLRDGVNAVTPGLAGNSALLSSLQLRLNESRSPASGNFLPGSLSFSGLVTDVTSRIATERVLADNDATFSATRAETLEQAALAEGVDTDQELQAMMEIERLYAANARVIQSVDAMLDELMRIGR